MATHRFSYASDLGWANGEAPSKFAGSPATYDPSTVGVDIFRNIGELSAGFTKTEIGGSNVTDQITQMKVASIYDGSNLTREVIAYGTAGKLYRITDATTPAVTVVKTVSNAAQGLELHKDYAYYAQTTQIGRYGILNAVSPTATDAYLTGLTGTVKGQAIKHPMQSWRGKLYVGDVNNLKYVIGSESAGTTGTTQMVFDSDYVITCLADGGSLLLIGVGQESVEDTQTRVSAWLATWDGTSATVASDTLPTDKFLFPEPYIHHIEMVDGVVYCFGLKYLYKLVGTSFQIVTKLDSRVALGGAEAYRGQLWFKGSSDIRSIGSPDPQLPVARQRPYNGPGTSITALKWVQDQKLWVSDNNDLFEYKTGSDTGVTWKSRVISFSQMEMVDEVRIYLNTNLASGDDVRVLIYDEAGTSYNAMTFDYATYGAVNQLVLHNNQLTTGVPQLSSMQVGVLFQAGAVRVREVIVKTIPVNQP
jgi:hypothetical protein